MSGEKTPFGFSYVEHPKGGITGPVAYRGKLGCQNITCTQEPFANEQGRCYGWHCSDCGRPCSMQGHFGGCPDPDEREQECWDGLRRDDVLRRYRGEPGDEA